MLILSRLQMLQETSRYLISSLKNAALLREPLHFTKDDRGIGKTFNLIQFAKAYGFSVIEPYEDVAIKMREKYLYERIISQQEMRTKTNRRMKAVIDDGVDFEDAKNYVDVITGWKLISTR